MAASNQSINDLLNREYAAGFITDVEMDTVPPGLSVADCPVNARGAIPMDLSNIRGLYEEVILDHNRNPRNFMTEPEGANRHAHRYNPVCNDEFTVHLKIDDGIITAAGFAGAEGDVEGYEIECPRHGACFDLRTGKVTAPPAYEDVATFAIRVHAGMVQVRDERPA